MLDSYHFTAILFIVVLIYSVSLKLVKSKKINLLFHRKIWNYTLLFSFLISGLLGLTLTFLIDYKMSIAWYRELLWLHVEFGVIMAIVSIFHLFWHRQYYLGKFKK